MLPGKVCLFASRGGRAAGVRAACFIPRMWLPVALFRIFLILAIASVSSVCCELMKHEHDRDQRVQASRCFRPAFIIPSQATKAVIYAKLRPTIQRLGKSTKLRLASGNVTTERRISRVPARTNHRRPLNTSRTLCPIGGLFRHQSQVGGYKGPFFTAYATAVGSSFLSFHVHTRPPKRSQQTLALAMLYDRGSSFATFSVAPPARDHSSAHGAPFQPGRETAGSVA